MKLNTTNAATCASTGIPGTSSTPTNTAAAAKPSQSMNAPGAIVRSEEHTSELQSLMRITYAVFCLKKTTPPKPHPPHPAPHNVHRLPHTEQKLAQLIHLSHKTKQNLFQHTN